MQPMQIVIFGITGDLAKRKLLPALYNLNINDQLPENLEIYGISRSWVNIDHLFESVKKHLPNKYDKKSLNDIKNKLILKKLDLDNIDAYIALRSDIEQNHSLKSHRLYYLSIPSQAFKQIVINLGKARHNEAFDNESTLPKLLVEKPFGHDLKSAKELIKTTNKYFKECQVFRIDHYLAKETAQNIMTFRFYNPIFESIWNSNYIESISISALEKIGIEGRSNFYEKTGALRDVIQSHLFQLLSLVTMERPLNFNSDEIHRSKQRLIDSISIINPDEVWENTLRAQYIGYKDEAGNKNSRIETYAKINLLINNQQWRNTKIFLEAGKALHEKYTKIHVKFKSLNENDGINCLIFRL